MIRGVPYIFRISVIRCPPYSQTFAVGGLICEEQTTGVFELKARLASSRDVYHVGNPTSPDLPIFVTEHRQKLLVVQIAPSTVDSIFAASLVPVGTLVDRTLALGRLFRLFWVVLLLGHSPAI